MIIYKICCDCKEKKPMEDYGTNDFSPDGRSSRCNSCCSGNKKMATNVEIPVKISPNETRVAPETKASGLWTNDVHPEIDVVIHPVIMEWVIDQAIKEFRTPELQINYILNKAMNKQIVTSNM